MVVPTNTLENNKLQPLLLVLPEPVQSLILLDC